VAGWDGKPEGRLGLVLSGGGARGAFQVGVYERLLEDPRFARGPAVLSGTSAGAINAALIAAGRSPEELWRFWRRLAEDPPAVANARFFESLVRELLRLGVVEPLGWWRVRERLVAFLRHARRHVALRLGSLLALWAEYLVTARFDLASHLLERIREAHLADTTRLRARLVEAFGGEQVPLRGRALAVNAVDAHTGAIVRYVAGGAGTVKDLSRQPDYVLVDAITVDMVLASASIPLLFPAVPVGGRLLWDGGLLVNTPLAPVVDLGADEIVTILVTPRPRARGDAPFANLGEAIERTVDGFLENAYNVDRKLLLARNRLASLEPHYRTVTLFEAVRPGDERCFRAGSYVYFAPEVLAEMRAAGRRAAAAWLAEGPRVDHLEPPPPARTIVHIPLPPRRRDALQPV
jgi:NTE family protein